MEPRVLLLDEPFGALDAKVRKELRRWLRRLHDELHVASVFVTHDQEEALEVSDRVAIMNHGQIEQVGTPAEVYDNPATLSSISFSATSICSTAAPKPASAMCVRTNSKSGRIPESRANAVVATVRFIAAAGPSVRLEL